MPKRASETLVHLPIDTSFGSFIARYSEQGLVSLDMPSKRPFTLSPDTPKNIRRWHKLTTRCLKNALANKPLGRLPPLDLVGSEFQKRVWEHLRKIRRGRTISYMQLAEAIRQPKSMRAVGSACGANPLPVLIPCHRVVAQNGKLGGFSSGIDWKWRLLAIEQATVGGNKLLAPMFQPTETPSNRRKSRKLLSRAT